jgi:hypothetical protein
MVILNKGTLGFRSKGFSRSEHLRDYLNDYSDTESGGIVRELRSLCVEFATSGGDTTRDRIHGILKANPVQAVVSSTMHFNSGVPFFNFIGTSKLTKRPQLEFDVETREMIANMQLPDVLMSILVLMQDNELNLVRQCDYCGSWIVAIRKDQRWCSKPKSCKKRWHEGTEKYKQENAKRARERYRNQKERNERSKVLSAKAH